MKSSIENKQEKGSDEKEASSELSLSIVSKVSLKDISNIDQIDYNDEDSESQSDKRQVT